MIIKTLIRFFVCLLLRRKDKTARDLPNKDVGQGLLSGQWQLMLYGCRVTCGCWCRAVDQQMGRSPQVFGSLRNAFILVEAATPTSLEVNCKITHPYWAGPTRLNFQIFGYEKENSVGLGKVLMQRFLANIELHRNILTRLRNLNSCF